MKLFKLKKKLHSNFYLGLMLLIGSLLSSLSLLQSHNNCITYFQGITQCGFSAILGIFVITLLGVILIIHGIIKRK